MLRILASWTHFRYAYGFLNPHTRLRVRLLGPCFKTGQIKLFRQVQHCSLRPQCSFEHRKSSHALNPTSRPQLAYWLEKSFKKTSSQCISLSASFSTISSLLTLFSKFFSSFLHSTCSLSVSHKYLALEEVYLPISAAVPSNATLRNLAYSRLIAEYGSITLFAASFQRLLRSSCLLQDSIIYNSMTFQPQIFILSFYRFVRHYWGNPC